MNQTIHSSYYLGDKPQCTQDTPCDFGKGICWTDDDCKEDLFCGKSNCVGELLDPWNNCCTNSTSTSSTTINTILNSKYLISIENFNTLVIRYKSISLQLTLVNFFNQTLMN